MGEVRATYDPGGALDSLRDQLLAAAERERRLRRALEIATCSCFAAAQREPLHHALCRYVLALEAQGLSLDPPMEAP